MKQRTLLILNKTAGLGQETTLLEKLRRRLEGRIGQEVDAESTEGHAQVTQVTTEFLRSNKCPVAIIVAGGGGTLRAVVEAVCRKRPAALKDNSVTLAQLRLGSGNVLAKHFGIPKDPLKGIDMIADGIKNRRTTMHPIIQAQHNKRILYGATLCGLGQFGKVPGDLARWHERYERTRRFLGDMIGIEKVTLLEYPVALLIRCIGCTFTPRCSDDITITIRHKHNDIRLLAGAIMTFPLNKLPFNPTASGKPPSVSAHLIPWKPSSALLLVIAPRFVSRRAIDINLTTNDILTIEEKGTHEFFLDEDPETFNGRLSLGCAGRLPFITGEK
jgi:hypothetical protein